jgi:hypothetical protein
VTANPLRSKALGVLRAGRVTLLFVRSDNDTQQVVEALAKVKSSRPGDRFYATEYIDGVWACTCGRDGCPHVAALQLVTGHAPAELRGAA